MSDFMDKAKDAVGDREDNPLLEEVEDFAESKADDVIDQITGTKD